MNACGLIVEYNPFHNGHLYHMEESKKTTEADCMIAVMSGNFLQRGEPAIIDKFHRAKIAVNQGIDLVVELPFAYAVQNSDLFAKGAVLILGALGVSALCFGSEHGKIHSFSNAYRRFQERENTFNDTLKLHLNNGLSFPEASKHAYHSIGLTEGDIDLSKPNNILGFSYVRSIYENKQPIKPVTIKRTKNNFHDKEIHHSIASATSIRKQLLEKQYITSDVKDAIPKETCKQLEDYKSKTGIWHDWEKYFQILKYRVLTMSVSEIKEIHGVEEGLEYRIKRTASEAINFDSWMNQLKTKRYTWTRLQRILVNLLTNTKKEDISSVTQSQIPYIRVLGMSKQGQAYLNKIKKQLDIPIISTLKNHDIPLLALEERASNAYYSIIEPEIQISMQKQKILPPYITY